MPNGEYNIDEETFKGMTVKQQNWITYTTFNQYRNKTDGRLKRLERRKKVDTAVAGSGGFIGGIIAVLGKYLLFKD